MWTIKPTKPLKIPVSTWLVPTECGWSFCRKATPGKGLRCSSPSITSQYTFYAQIDQWQPLPQHELYRVAFESCAQQWQNQPIWDNHDYGNHNGGAEFKQKKMTNASPAPTLHLQAVGVDQLAGFTYQLSLDELK